MNHKKVNLGCGPHKLADYADVDIDVAHNAKYNYDATFFLAGLADDSVTHIVMGHLIQCMNLKQFHNLMLETVRVLSTTGTILVSFPDAVKVSDHFNKGFLQPQHIDALLLGPRSNVWNVHGMVLTTNRVIDMMSMYGLYCHMEAPDDTRLAARVGWQGALLFDKQPRIMEAEGGF